MIQFLKFICRISADFQVVLEIYDYFVLVLKAQNVSHYGL